MKPNKNKAVQLPRMPKLEINETNIFESSGAYNYFADMQKKDVNNMKAFF